MRPQLALFSGVTALLCALLLTFAAVAGAGLQQPTRASSIPDGATLPQASPSSALTDTFELLLPLIRLPAAPIPVKFGADFGNMITE
ncbi:MAG TPA: hypothetical protein PL187_20660, partial [Caldilinea sp.]|nr:hypothetical protein [Caldilinea sp.]